MQLYIFILFSFINLLSLKISHESRFFIPMINKIVKIVSLIKH